jgi:hypothetical protein
MPGYNPDRMNIKDLTIDEPVAAPTITKYSLGDRCRDGRSWVDSSKEAKREWDVFWGKSAESEEKWRRMKADDYRRLYTHLTGERVGPDASSRDDRLDGFDDNGIGYKDIEEKPLSSDCPPMPEQKNF